MEISKKKLKNGFEILEYGLGTWGMGGRREHNPDNDDASDIAGIRAAIDRGVTCIDTAEIYAQGYSETLLGRAIRGYDRSTLFISSKVSWQRPSREEVMRACAESLKRVGTDYFNLYLLHSYSDTIPLRESIEALDELMEKGFTKSIGVCNFGVEHLKEAQEYAKHPIVYNQVHYNLKYRECERKGLLEYCQKNDVFLAAWRPVQKGELLGEPPAVIREMCEKYTKTPAQIAINWLVSQENVITLAKTTKVKHLEENLGGIDWVMEKDDIERIRHEYPDQADISNAVPLE